MKNDAHSNGIYFSLSVHVPCKKCIALCLREMISVAFILNRGKEAHSLPDIIFHKHISHQVCDTFINNSPPSLWLL